MKVSHFSVSRAILELERNGNVEVTLGSPSPRRDKPSGRRLRVAQPRYSNGITLGIK